MTSCLASQVLVLPALCTDAATSAPTTLIGTDPHHQPHAFQRVVGDDWEHEDPTWKIFSKSELGWRSDESSWWRDAPKVWFSTPFLLPGSLKPTQPNSIVQAWCPSLATFKECCNQCWFARASVFEIISRNTLQVVEYAEGSLFL